MENTKKHYIVIRKCIEHYGSMYGIEFFGSNSKYDSLGFDTPDDARLYAEKILDKQR